MDQHTPQVRPLAIIAGIVCVLAALNILLGSSLLRPAEWTQYHANALFLVFLTIAFLHMRGSAWQSGNKTAACGFVLAAALGTALIVGQSVGRQAEATGATMMSAADINTRIARKLSDLDAAKSRLSNATRMADKEMTGQRCGPRCSAWRQNASDITNSVKQIEGELAALGPQKPVNAKAEKIADLAEVFGVPRQRAIAFWTLFEPFALALLCEFGSVLSFSYAFPHRTVVKQAVRPAKLETELPSDTELSDIRNRFFAPDNSENVVALFPDNPPNGSGPKPGKRSTNRKVEVLADIRSRIDAGERFESQEQLRSALNAGGQFGLISRSTLSDWLGEMSITRETEGRRKRVG